MEASLTLRGLRPGDTVLTALLGTRSERLQ